MAPYAMRRPRLDLPQRAPTYRVGRGYGRGYGRSARYRRGAYSTAAKALALARQIARDVEVKCVTDVNLNKDYQARRTWAYQLGGSAQGDGIDQRTGNKVTMKRIDLKARFSLLSVSNMTGRVLIVQDLQTVNATPPVITDILTSEDTLSSYNKLYTDRFKILYDVKKSFNANFLNGDQIIQFDIKLDKFAQGGKQEYYSSGSSAYSKNVIYAFFIADYASNGDVVTQSGAAGEMQMSMNWMAYFVD